MLIAKMVLYFLLVIVVLEAINSLVDCMEGEITPEQLMTRAVVWFFSGLAIFALIFALKSGIIV